MQPGNSFMVGFYSQEAEQIERMSFTLAGYVDNGQIADYVTVNGGWPWLVMSHTVAARIAKNCGYNDIGEMLEEELRIKLMGESENIKEYLQHIADDTESIGFLSGDSYEMEKTAMEAVADIVDIMLICFVFLTSGICLLNLGNAITGRMICRRREFAVLQSVGMTRPQIRKMLLFECSGMIAEAIVIAVLISAGFIWIIWCALSSLFGRIALRIPYELIVLAVVFTVGAVVLLTRILLVKLKGKICLRISERKVSKT